MGFLSNIFRRNTTMPTPPQPTGKVMKSESSPEQAVLSPLLYYNYGNAQALQLSAVYAALSIISNSIACLPIYVKQHKDDENVIVKNSSIRKLFYNMLQSKHVVVKQIVYDLLLYGNAFIYIKRTDGKPEKLIYMQHGDVQIDYRKQEGVVMYNCCNHKGVPAVVKQEDMLHFAKDTYDGVTGRGFLAFAKDTINLSWFTQKAAENFFGSGCNLTGILQFSGRLRDDQKRAIREQWSAIHGNSASGGGLGVLEGDAKYIPISQSSSDAQMLDTRAFNITEIARFFCISPILLGDLTHNSYSSIEDSNIEFVERTLLPLINLIEEEINRKLITNKDQYIDFDENDLLKANKSTMASFYSTLVSNGIITIDEAREQMGWNVFNDGYSNKILIPYTKISDNVINQDINETEEV